MTESGKKKLTWLSLSGITAKKERYFQQVLPLVIDHVIRYGQSFSCKDYGRGRGQGQFVPSKEILIHVCGNCE